MKRRVSMVLIALLCLGFAGASLAAESDAAATVGEFAVRLATMVTDKEYAPEGALKVLADAGVKLDGDLSDELTEATMAGVLNQLGYNLTTSTPENTVSLQQLMQVTGMLEDGPSALPCPPGFPGQSCNSVKCAGGANEGVKCSSDADCPGSYCRTPPGIAKKVATPSDG